MRICFSRCDCDWCSGICWYCALRRGIVTVWRGGRRTVCTGAAALEIVELVGVLFLFLSASRQGIVEQEYDAYHGSFLLLPKEVNVLLGVCVRSNIHQEA